MLPREMRESMELSFNTKTQEQEEVARLETYSGVVVVLHIFNNINFKLGDLELNYLKSNQKEIVIAPTHLGDGVVWL